VARHERGQHCDSLRRLLGVSPPQVSTPFSVHRAFSGPRLREPNAKADGLTPQRKFLARRFALVARCFRNVRDGGRLLEFGVLTNQMSTAPRGRAG
jgi:hypothetical protein